MQLIYKLCHFNFLKRFIVLFCSIIFCFSCSDSTSTDSSSSDYLVTTFAGMKSVFSYGFEDGKGTNARFSSLTDLEFDSNEDLFVLDAGNYAIRKIDTNGNVTTFAGGSNGSADGSGTDAQFGWLRKIALDKDNNIYVTDSTYSNIR